MTDSNIIRAGTSAEGLMAKFFGDAAPSTVFSEPHQIGDDVVFTAAAWERVGGFGFGGGTDNQDNGGGGAGGGGVSEGRPVAIIRLSASGTEVTALPDVTKIAVTVILAAVGVWRALRG
jgi:uncharacterized spore protein YtfJ